MEANVESAATLFADPGQYVIPIYQRPYVWDEVKQWRPLWEDIERVAEGELGRPGGAPDHFLGALVFQDQRSNNGNFHSRRVIDGQQRLITLQLILTAATVALKEANLGDHSVVDELVELIENPSVHVYAGSPHLKFKVWPTVGDQEQFGKVMQKVSERGDGWRDNPPTQPQSLSAHLARRRAAGASDPQTRIERAYDFFRDRFAQWIARVPEDIETRADALAAALRFKLKVVVIDLGFTDDPNVIFASLNARGTPLLQWDLAKNHLLHQHRVNGGDDEQLHARYFESLELNSWWRQDVKQGRLTTPRLEVFLRYWLTLRTRTLIAAEGTFQPFHEYVLGRDTNALAADLEHVARKYDELEHPAGDSKLARFVARWHVTQAHLMTPVLLWLLTEEVPVPEFERCLTALESFLVRRMICRLESQGLNKDIPSLLRALQNNRAPKAADTIIDELKNRSSAHAEWPSDERLLEVLVWDPLTKLTKARQRMVLAAIEAATPTGAPQLGPGPAVKEQGITLRVDIPIEKRNVEHVLPEKWRDLREWSDPPKNQLDEDPNELRDQLIGTIGNLALLQHEFRSPAPNSSWATKRAALQEFDDHALVRELLAHAPADEDWDEHKILDRSERLAEIAIKIWPPPDKI